MAALLAFGCGSVSAQDPVKAYPRNYSVVLNDPVAEVIRVHYGPHEKVGVHDHSNYPTVYVYLSDSGPVRFAHSEEKPFTVDRPPVRKGDFRVAPARPERHTVENLGDIATDFLRVELKQTPLKLIHPFRGEAPKSLEQNLDDVEFKDEFVQVERMVCVGPEACLVKPASAASLIVTFTAVELGSAQHGLEKVEAGTVRWMRPGDPLAVKQDSATPAHILRIVIPAGLVDRAHPVAH